MPNSDCRIRIAPDLAIALELFRTADINSDGRTIWKKESLIVWKLCREI